jgi:hypothetical protein
MTGRASPMRRRVCVTCDTRFAPKRLDAEFCSNRCRQAAHRKKIRIEAESVFKATSLQIAENVHDTARRLEFCQSWATIQNVEAERVGNEHVRFIGTQRGILAVQAKCEYDLLWSAPWKPHMHGTKELKHDPSNPEVGDPEVIEAVIEALNHETLGGSFIQREFEKECQALLRGPVKRISLFIEDPDWLNKPPPGGWVVLSTPWWDDRDDVGNWDRDNDYAGGETGADLLAGGGFQVAKP